MKRLTDEDFDMLLPGEHINLGKTSILIKPLAPFSDQFKMFYLMLKDLEGKFIEKGINSKNFPFKLKEVVEIILENSPDILSLITDIHEDDLKRLPLDKIMEIAETIVNVNKKSFEGFEKNSNTWLAMATKMLRGGMLIFSIFSSGQVIKETKSNPTLPVK